MSTALITGISGQDGWFLARQLLDEGHAVVGLTRNRERALTEFHDWDVQPRLVEFTYGQQDLGGLFEEVQPDWVFNLASFATGQGMFDHPHAMVQLNGLFVVDLLEAIRRSARAQQISFVQASSSEMFGEVQQCPQSETTPFRPKSPYGAAKLLGHQMVGIYRRTFSVRASSAILYNHESVRRPAAFVTKKIARAAARIRLGLQQQLELGSLEIDRDWGYAPEYMDALARMARADAADDYVVATGRLAKIRDLVQIAFASVGLDWEQHVNISPDFARPVESIGLCGNPSHIEQRLNWRAKTGLAAIIQEMVEYELLAARQEAMNA